VPTRIPRAVLRRFSGKRSKFLIIHAVVYTLIGYSYISINPPTGSTRAATFAWLPDWFPTGMVGWAWVIAAAFALWSSVERTPPRSDRLGFAALVAMSLCWAMMFLISWIKGHAPTGWVSAAVYAGYAAVIMLIASWPNPVQPTLPPVEELPEVDEE
jgi:hypothetical protein